MLDFWLKIHGKKFIFFFHLNSENKKKTLITQDNIEEYCDKYDLSLKK